MRLFILTSVFIISVLFVQGQEKQRLKKSDIKVNSGMQTFPENVNTDPTNYLLLEGFDGTWLPDEWQKIDFHPVENWTQSNPENSMLNFDRIDELSKFSALVQWLPENQNEWLISPQIVANEFPTTLHWYAGVSGPWLMDATLRCLISIDNGENWTEIWNAVDEISPISDWSWNKIVLNLNEFADEPFQLAWNYVGNNGDLAGIDGIHLISGENYIYFSDFEDYAVNEMVVLNDTTGSWTTWNEKPGSFEDAFIVDDQAHSPTKSVEVVDSNNLILKLGEKTEGKYKIQVKYFIPNHKSAGFNVQHFQQPGLEEAFSILFKPNGIGQVNAGMENAKTFNYDQGEWNTITTFINMDDNWTELLINNELIYEWPFHYQSTTDNGTLQLGSINFRNIAPQNDSSGFFFDDIEFISIETTLSPKLFISDTSFTENINNVGTHNNTIKIGNLGIQELVFQNVITYPLPFESIFQNNLNSPKLNSESKINGISVNDSVLKYDGENVSAVGNGVSDYNWKIASMFPSDLIKPHIGKEIYKIDIYFSDLPTDTKIQLFDMGSFISGQPGDLIYEQDFTPVPNSWNSIVLDSSIYLDGSDIWVACQLSGELGTHIPGVDIGPADKNGNWILFSDKWEHLSDYSSVNANWNIRAYLKSEAIIQWLSVSDTTGTLMEYEYTDLITTIDGRDLITGDYYCELLVRNNDPDKQEQKVKFNLTIINDLNEFGEKIQILIYPNPVSDRLVIESNEELLKIELINISGEVLYLEMINNKKTIIFVSRYPSGIYLLKATNKHKSNTVKVIIE